MEESLHQKTWRWLDPLNCPLDEYAEVLCFVCNDGSRSPFPLEGVAGGCAVWLWGGLCAADSGNDGFGGCKAHGCGLLVKTKFSGHPSLCFHDVVVCCHNYGFELLGYRYRSHVLQLVV